MNEQREQSFCVVMVCWIIQLCRWIRTLTSFPYLILFTFLFLRPYFHLFPSGLVLLLLFLLLFLHILLLYLFLLPSSVPWSEHLRAQVWKGHMRDTYCSYRPDNLKPRLGATVPIEVSFFKRVKEAWCPVPQTSVLLFTG